MSWEGGREGEREGGRDEVREGEDRGKERGRRRRRLAKHTCTLCGTQMILNLSSSPQGGYDHS